LPLSNAHIDPQNNINPTAAIIAPIIGPRTGTQAYFQSLSRLFGIGRRKCMIRGPRSRAGLMAYPVASKCFLYAKQKKIRF
jgi:hypothetical protein